MFDVVDRGAAWLPLMLAVDDVAME